MLLRLAKDKVFRKRKRNDRKHAFVANRSAYICS